MFSVGVNANHTCSNKLTILTLARKYLSCLYFGRTLEKEEVLCFSSLNPWCHLVITTTKQLSSSSQQILLLILKYKELLNKGPVAQKEDYAMKIKTCGTIILLVQVFPLFQLLKKIILNQNTLSLFSTDRISIHTYTGLFIYLKNRQCQTPCQHMK